MRITTLMHSTPPYRQLLTLVICSVQFWVLAGKSYSQQPTVHAVIVGDVSPAAGWGSLAANISADTVGMFAILVNGLPESQFRYYPLTLQEDAWATPSNVLSYLAEVAVEPTDTLLFYFSGHGAADDKGHYLQLAGGKLYRADIRQAMSAKSARLNVLLSDCCNLRADGFSYFAPQIIESPPPRATPILDSLLIKSEGWVDLNACSPGEGAFFGADDPETGGMPGSLFTSALLDLLQSQSQTALNWNQVVDQVRVEVYLAFRQTYPKGAVPEEGFGIQTEQNVYAYQYPGMPPRSGPRTGLTVRDDAEPGVVIVRVESDSPASQSFHVRKQAFVSLESGQRIVIANNQAIRSVEDLVAEVARSPQLMRLVILSPLGGESEFLMSLRY